MYYFFTIKKNKIEEAHAEIMMAINTSKKNAQFKHFGVFCMSFYEDSVL